jgi:hypothetical protein
MALSMTGCGEGVATAGGSTCRVELRGVNNRHFKLTLRARDTLAALEPRIEAAVRGHVRRGTVQVTVDLSGAAAMPAAREARVWPYPVRAPLAGKGVAGAPPPPPYRCPAASAAAGAARAFSARAAKWARASSRRMEAASGVSTPATMALVLSLATTTPPPLPPPPLLSVPAVQAPA